MSKKDDKTPLSEAELLEKLLFGNTGDANEAELLKELLFGNAGNVGMPIVMDGDDPEEVILALMPHSHAKGGLVRGFAEVSSYEVKLRASFENVAFGKYGGITTCVVPNVYSTEPEKPKSDIQILYAVQGQGSNREESAKDLFYKLASMPVYEHFVRPDVDESLIVEARYRPIYQDDPEHSHEGAGLHDFMPVLYTPFEDRFLRSDKVEFGGLHNHLMPLE